jgi:hypothetical protein
MTDKQTNDDQPMDGEESNDVVVVSGGFVVDGSTVNDSSDDKGSSSSTTTADDDSGTDDDSCTGDENNDTSMKKDFKKYHLKTLREFFIRAFLYEKYPLPKELYNYDFLSSILQIDFKNKEVTFRVSTTDRQLVDYLIKFYRERQNPVKVGRGCPGGYFSILSIEADMVVFRASLYDVKAILEYFFEPVTITLSGPDGVKKISYRSTAF